MEKIMYMRFKRVMLTSTCALLIFGGTVSWGQKPPPAAVGNSQAPVLAMPMPLGMQRGTTMELLLTGANLAGPTGLMTGFPAQVTISSEDKNGQDNSKLKVRL